jgi:dihydroneopterin aldolase
MPTDRITLSGLKIQANHGVLDFERANGQLFIVDVIVWLDLSPAAAADDLTKTVNYAELADEIHAAVSTDPVDLIETVAERVAQVVLAHNPVQQVEVTVHKPQAPIAVNFDDVAVTIVRTRVA